jgi:hypothetical protein
MAAWSGSNTTSKIQGQSCRRCSWALSTQLRPDYSPGLMPRERALSPNRIPQHAHQGDPLLGNLPEVELPHYLRNHSIHTVRQDLRGWPGELPAWRNGILGRRGCLEAPRRRQRASSRAKPTECPRTPSEWRWLGYRCYARSRRWHMRSVLSGTTSFPPRRTKQQQIISIIASAEFSPCVALHERAAEVMRLLGCSLRAVPTN